MGGCLLYTRSLRDGHFGKSVFSFNIRTFVVQLSVLHALSGITVPATFEIEVLARSAGAAVETSTCSWMARFCILTAVTADCFGLQFGFWLSDFGLVISSVGAFCTSIDMCWRYMCETLSSIR